MSERMQEMAAGAALAILLGLFTIFSSPSARASDLRYEASIGQCKYGKAQDGTWWKDGYQTETDLKTNCGSVGISQMVFDLPHASALGWRASYVDFGIARAHTFVPVRDDQANDFPSGANCDVTNNFSGCVGEYRQSGKARGFTLGPVLEKRFNAITVGIESGLYYYYSYWAVDATIPGPGTCPTCAPMPWSWDGARGWHTTWYVGAQVEYEGLFLRARRFNATYASQAEVNPLFIGLISGPLYSVEAGVQWRF
jgi:hypothetical protein